MSKPMSNKSAGLLGAAMFIFGVAGILTGTSRIDEPLFAVGNLVSAALLVISTWINTTVKLSKGKETGLAPKGDDT